MEKEKLNLQKWIPIFSFALVFLLTFCVNWHIPLFGDDYYYIGFSTGTLQEFFEHHAMHYLEVNGRAIVHFLISIFLFIDSYWWKIVNSLMLAGIAFLGTKIATYSDKKRNVLHAAILFFSGICLLNIDVTRQSVYWLTGSFNYVYPIFMLFLYWYHLLKWTHTKKGVALTCIFGLLAAATVEQVALMTLGVTVLSAFFSFLNQKGTFFERIGGARMLFLCILTLLGTLSVICSPSTFIRYGLETKEEIAPFLAIKDAFRYLINVFFFSKVIFPYHLFIMAASFLVSLKIRKELDGKKEKLALLSAFISILSIFIAIFNTFIIKDVASFGIQKIFFSIIFGLMYFFIFTVLTYLIYQAKLASNWYLLPLTAILLIGSQVMMVISPVYGLRNNLCGIFMLLLYAAILFSYIEIPHKKSNFTTNLQLNSSPSKEKIVTHTNWIYNIFILGYTCLILVSILFIARTANGYAVNHKIEIENKERIEAYHKNPSDSLTLKKLPDDRYGWSMPYYSPYHEDYYKRYYEIDATINWI